MKKYWIIFLLIPFLSFVSCIDDESAYLPQEKEDVNVDNGFQVDTTHNDEELPDGQLIPGLHTVTLKVEQTPGEFIERQFKYYMPVSLDASKPISLVFEFHGSYSFEAGDKPSNPLADVKETHILNQNSIKGNYVVCYPAGELIFHEDSSGTINWQNSEYHLPFVDAMLKYFTEDNTPSVDPNRIYSTGQSSGAIFSFYLAFARSDKFAAIAPRAGQMSLEEATTRPQRAVPVRVFAGEKDDHVIHSAVLNNMTAWAEKIGGYFQADMQIDTTVYEDYADVTIRYWHGGRADYEIYSLAGIGHNIAITKCVDDMWSFMSNHPMDNTTENLFVTTSLKEINAKCGEPFEFKISYNEGANLEMTNAPQGWNTQLNGNTVTLTAPKDYFGEIDRQGAITFTVTQNGQTVSCEVTYFLTAPKAYFEVGDIYYNERLEPVGIVFWVNRSNIREAKILNLQEVTTQGQWQTINFGNFGTFTTPDEENGEENTRLHMQQNATLDRPLNAVSSGLVWAATYSYKEVTEWYLPAINELKAMDEHIALLDEKLEELGGEKLVRAQAYDGYLSSTVTLSNGQKCFNMMSFYSHKTTTQVGTNTSYYRARAIKKVSK